MTLFVSLTDELLFLTTEKIKSDTKDLFVKDDYTDDYGDDSGEEKDTPDYPDNAVVVPE